MNLVAKIECRIAENKSSIKTYKSYETACKTGEDLGLIFATKKGVQFPVEFIPVYLPSLNRWTVVFQQMAWMQRYSQGGYIGWFATNGFFSI